MGKILSGVHQSILTITCRRSIRSLAGARCALPGHRSWVTIATILLALLLSGVAQAGTPSPSSQSVTNDSGPWALFGSFPSTDGGLQVYDDTVWPTVAKELSSPFGPRLKASDNYRYDFHRGIDIPGTQGDPVFGIADGEVFRTYFEGESGNPYPNGGTVIIIRHTADKPIVLHGASHQQYYSIYMHLDSILVQPANPGGPYQQVAKGQTIGTLGHSGTTSFDHLHFETRIGTTCSREYQQSHPEASCSDYFGAEPADPHINPLAFLDYPDHDSLQVEVSQTHPLRVLVRSPRNDLDFNQILVSYAGKVHLVDFNSRSGIDPANMDNNSYGNVVILPAKFNTGSQFYEITFEFEDFDGFEYIEARDIWGKSIRLQNSQQMNVAPVVVAAVASEPNTVSFQLKGSVLDDFTQKSDLVVSWTQISGPGLVLFDDPNLADAKATFTAPGTYVLHLSVSDGQLSSSDDVQVEVLNQP